MFCNFYLVKNHKIENKSTTTEAREKYRFLILRILELFVVVFAKFKNDFILLNVMRDGDLILPSNSSLLERAC